MKRALIGLVTLTTACNASKQPSTVNMPQVSWLTASEREAVIAWDKDRRDETTPLEFHGAAVDLNSDGKKEIVARLERREYCGSGGCTLIVLTPDSSGYRLAGRSTLTGLPIYVLPTTSSGWLDLGVTVGGGGHLGPPVSRLPFDGVRYASNPTVPPASAANVTDATILMAAPK